MKRPHAVQYVIAYVLGFMLCWAFCRGFTDIEVERIEPISVFAGLLALVWYYVLWCFIGRSE